MYKYETHLHTNPVSRCAKATVEETIDFYKGLNYDGIFITNHFINANINIDLTETYEKKITFYFSDYENALKYGRKAGLKVFLGIETTYHGTDFLVYGLDKEWFLNNPQIEDMEIKQRLKHYMDCDALVIQAHPYREASYISHIRLFPRCVHGVEVINSNRLEQENKMAQIYAQNYELIKFAGSDNHSASLQTKLAGLCFETPITDVQDFIKRVKENMFTIFEDDYTEGI